MSSNNKIYHNNFINNENQAFDVWKNHWNHEFPYGGNYWSDYSGVDEFKGKGQNIKGSDGYGDESYKIEIIGGITSYVPTDNYPLITPFINISNIEFYDLVTPTAPENLKAQVGKAYILLTWDPPIHTGKNPIYQYIIYRGLTKNNITNTITIKNENAMQYNDTNVNNSQTYYYLVAGETWDGIGQNASINVTVPKAKPKRSGGSEQPLYRLILIIMLIIFALLIIIMRLSFKRKTKKLSNLHLTIEKTLKGPDSPPKPEDQEKNNP
jgi:hypothetical protein